MLGSKGFDHCFVHSVEVPLKIRAAEPAVLVDRFPPSPSRRRGSGQSTLGYLSSLCLNFSPLLRAGVSPTFVRARKSSRDSSEGLERTALGEFGSCRAEGQVTDRQGSAVIFLS